MIENVLNLTRIPTEFDRAARKPFPITFSPHVPTLAEMLDARQRRAEQGDWIPAHNGTETPFVTRNGYRLLYCYQASTGRHAYLDMGTDMILTDQQARLALGTY